MNITFDKNEMIDNKTVAGLLLFFNHTGNPEGARKLLNDHVENYYQLYNYIIDMSNYRVEQLALDSCKKLNEIHIVFSEPTRLSFKERKEIMEPYRNDIIDKIIKERYRRSYYIPRPLTYTYADIFTLGIDISEINEDDIEKYVNKSSSINMIYKHIFKPVMDGEVKLDNDARRLIFGKYVYQMLIYARRCSVTNNNLNTIKSIFHYTDQTLQQYLQIFDYINEHYDELGCDEHVDKDKYRAFNKKFNKWVCGLLIK